MNRNLSLDLLRFLMAFMVIGIHSGFLGDYSSLLQYLTVNGVFRVAVPVFLIINGFYFSDFIDSGGWGEWFKKVFILYVLWMLVYSYFWFVLPEFTVVGFLKLFIDLVFGYHHLWYLSGMLGAAFLLKITRGFSLPVLCLFALVLFACGVFVQYAGNYHIYAGTVVDRVFNMHWVHRNALFLCYPFFCIGYLIRKYKFLNVIGLGFSGCLVFFGMVFLFFESLSNYNDARRDGGFDNYISLLFVSPFVFVFFAKLNFVGRYKLLSSLSSSIYFIHPLVFVFLGYFFGLKETFLGLFGFLFSFFVSWLAFKLHDRVKLVFNR